MHKVFETNLKEKKKWKKWKYNELKAEQDSPYQVNLNITVVSYITDSISHKDLFGFCCDWGLTKGWEFILAFRKPTKRQQQG